MDPEEDKLPPPPQKLSPEDPAARDEGPRLIPFPERRKQPRGVEPNRHYLELADIAIREDDEKKAK